MSGEWIRLPDSPGDLVPCPNAPDCLHWGSAVSQLPVPFELAQPRLPAKVSAVLCSPTPGQLKPHHSPGRACSRGLSPLCGDPFSIDHHHISCSPFHPSPDLSHQNNFSALSLQPWKAKCIKNHDCTSELSCFSLLFEGKGLQLVTVMCK